MSVRTVKNNHSLIVGKTLARTATVQYTNPSGASYLADGEVLVVRQDGTIMAIGSVDTIGEAPKIQIIQRSGDRLIYSPIIDGANVLSFKGTDGVAAVEQVTNIGYNGTTGSIDVSGTDDYIFNLTFTFNEMNWSEQLNNFPFIVDALSGAITETEVANSLAKQINYQMTNGGQASIAGEGPLVKATILSADAGVAIGAITDTVVGAAGSKTVTITDVGADASVIAIAAGAYFRAGTATTSPVYKVASSTVGTGGGVLTLEMPLQANVNLVGTTAEFIAAPGTAAAGVVLTGQALKWQLDFFKYMQVTFRTSYPQGWGATTIATTAATRPIGYGQQLAEVESFDEGFRGKLNRTTIPLPTAKTDVVSTTTYDSISIVWEDTSDTTPVDGTKPARQEIQIIFPDAAATQITDATNGVLTVLNAYMATTPRAFVAVTL